MQQQQPTPQQMAQFQEMSPQEMQMPYYPYANMFYPYSMQSEAEQPQTEAEIIRCQCQCEKCQCDDVERRLLEQFNEKLEAVKAELFEQQKAAWLEYGKKMGYV